MDSYFIFAIALTVVYIIYYAVIVVQDLYGKKGTDKPGEEIFDLDMEDSTEESIDVSENDTGFSIGSEKYDTENFQPASEPPQETDTDQGEGAAQERFEQLKAKVEARLEDTEPYLSDPRQPKRCIKQWSPEDGWTGVPNCHGNLSKISCKMSNTKKILCTLCSIIPCSAMAKKRQCELQLGRRCTGHDARFRSYQYAVCPIHLLRYRLALCHRVRAPDLHQVECRCQRHSQVPL